MFPLFESTTGYIILALYAVVSFSLVRHFASGYTDSKESFLLARRELNAPQGALSIAAAWLWAPGLFISTQQAYLNGLVGLFWFCLGNFLTLGLFAYFAKKIRDTQPEGFTFSGWIKEKFSGKAYWFYRVEMLLLAVCAFAINLIAGGSTVALLTGIDYTIATILMGCIALLYTFSRGLKATVVTEIIKIVVVWAGVLLLVPMVIASAGGLDVVTSGLGGITGNGKDIIGTDFSWAVFTGFGIAAFLGHLGGPWRDNSFYQRAFSLKPKSIIPAFVMASFAFIIIPIMMGLLGFVAAGYGLNITPDVVGNTNAIVIANFLPIQASMVFCFMVFAGLIGILDSQMASVTNIIGNDFTQNEKDSISNAKKAMMALAVVGIIVANIPGITLQDLFLFFSIMGATLFIPSVMVVLKPSIFTSGSGLFTGLVLGFVCSQVLYFTGFTFAATLTATFFTPIACIVADRFFNMKLVTLNDLW